MGEIKSENVSAVALDTAALIYYMEENHRSQYRDIR